MNVTPKLVPFLGDFRLIPNDPSEDDDFHLVIYRDANGELQLAQWVLGAFPPGIKPLYYHPIPVHRLDLTNGFHREVKAKLPRWEEALAELEGA